MTDRFDKNIILSAVAHGAVALLLFVRAILVPSDPIDLRAAIRVDIVGLPEKITEPIKLEPPAPKTTPAPDPVPTSKPKVEAKSAPKAPTMPVKSNKKDLAKAQADAFKNLQRSSALDRIKNEVSQERSSSKAAGLQIKGNKVSEGNSLQGIERLDYDKYTDELRSRIHSQFVIPQWLAEANYRAQVQVMIDERGNVIKKVMKLSSGNEIFDSKVIEAIDSSSPLPAPPQRLQSVLATSGVLMSFPE